MKILSALLASALFVTVPLRAGDYQPGEIGSLAILLTTEKAREHLALTPAQSARLDAVRASYREDARAIAARKLETPDQRAAAEADLSELTAASNRRALAVLTPAQRGDVVAIEHKFLGGTLLYSEAIQKKTGVTPAQSAQIAAIRKESLAAAAAINRQFEDGKISFAQRMAKLRAQRLSASKKILGLLNPAQRDAFSQLGGSAGC